MTKEELKQEAEEYAETKGKEHFRKFYNTNKNIAELIAQVYIDSAEPREKHIAELEKESAELKAFKQNCIKLTEDNVVMARQRAEMADQLTKAKELLRRCYDNYIYLQPLRGDIEQFLNSDVEK